VLVEALARGEPPGRRAKRRHAICARWTSRAWEGTWPTREPALGTETVAIWTTGAAGAAGAAKVRRIAPWGKLAGLRKVGRRWLAAGYVLWAAVLSRLRLLYLWRSDDGWVLGHRGLRLLFDGLLNAQILHVAASEDNLLVHDI